jgi:flagellar operon protein (TIGR03826 family)
MEVRNCRSCGRLFNVLSGERICPSCRQKLEDKFQEVKAYLNDHANASVDEVSKANDVSPKQITQWIREERLTFAEGSMEGIACESCGKMIRTGRYCEECKAKMANNLMNAIDQPKAPEPKPEKPEKSGNRMRFLNK